MGCVNYRSLIVVMIASMGTACQKNMSEKTFRAKPEKQLLAVGAGVRLSTVQLYADTVYVITETFNRTRGERLLIEPGTVIKVSPGVGIDIQPGAVIQADGTRDQPIVFTSNLVPGAANNYWLGISISGDASGQGVVAGDPGDNSGSLKFVRVEFGSVSFTNVGRGTVVDHVQASYSNFTPAFQFKGGTVNAKYLVSYACNTGADYYMGDGYTGHMQFVLAYRHPFFGTSRGLPANSIAGIYIENNASQPLAVPQTRPVLSNVTMVGPAGRNGTGPIYSDTSANANAAAFVTTSNARFRIRNSALLGYPANGWKIVDSLTARSVHFLESEFTHSLVHCIDTARTFFILPRVYRRYDAKDFREYMLETRFNNQLIYSINDFGFKNLFSYDVNGPVPAERSVLLTGASFDGNDYNIPFFDKVSFTGAVGVVNWMEGWTNFTPLKTSYNQPQ